MRDEKSTAIVLLSGGMDSALCLALAVKDNYIPATLHLNYGQRTQKKELQAFEKLSNYYNVKERLVVDVNHLSQIGGSSLTDSKINVAENAIEESTINNVPNSYVPFRNANILAIAVSWAEVINAKAIYIGASQVDFSGYPDCKAEFFDAFQNVINTGTKPETNINIITPLINLTKTDIVRDSLKLNVPIEYTWSCYQNDDEACGVCDSCLLRLKGFKEAEFQDKIKYKSS